MHILEEIKLLSKYPFWFFYQCENQQTGGKSKN